MNWRRVLTMAVVLLTLLMGLALPVQADSAAAVQWLKTQQHPDGGFGDEGSTASMTAEVVLGLAAAGQDPHAWRQGDNTPLTYLAGQAKTAAATVGGAAKLILAVVAAGEDPRRFGGVDLVTAVEGMYDPATGRFGGEQDTLLSHAVALMALKAAGRPIPAEAVTWLKKAQLDEGSWSWNGDRTPGTADTNSTALVIQALVAAGVARGDPAIRQALEYLRGQQNPDGGFPYVKPSPYGTETDANSTAVVIQVLVAAGEDPTGAAWTRDGHTPLSALQSLQTEEGAFVWKAEVPGANLLATAQALPALALKPLPLTPVILPVSGASATLWPWWLALVGIVLIALGLLVRRTTTTDLGWNG